MRIAINGTGVAGPTLAWWLKHYGFEPVLFEQAPELRNGGYVIDFWGLGYDIAEKMEILPQLHEKGYDVTSLRIVDKAGCKIAELKTKAMRSLSNGRFLSVPRSDLSATLFKACTDIETRFDTSITSVDQQSDGVIVQLSDGSTERFDLVIGADGLHSHIRTSVFGNEDANEHSLGAHVAALTVDGYAVRNELTYVMHQAPKRQLARMSLRDNKTLFLFTFLSELVAEKPETIEEEKAILRSAFADMGWETQQALECLEDANDFYFDSVSQIRMPHWRKGRVGLIGDAAACASLLAGEGTGLAMAEAYVLAGELHRARGDFVSAFSNYEQKLQPFLATKQKEAAKMVSFFAPRNKFQIALNIAILKASSIPLLASFFIGRMLRDDIELPDYS